MGTMGSAVTFLLLLSGLALVVFARARAQNKWTALLKDLATEWGLEVVEGPHDHVIDSGRRGPLEVGARHAPDRLSPSPPVGLLWGSGCVAG